MFCNIITRSAVCRSATNLNTPKPTFKPTVQLHPTLPQLLSSPHPIAKSYRFITTRRSGTHHHPGPTKNNNTSAKNNTFISSNPFNNTTRPHHIHTQQHATIHTSHHNLSFAPIGSRLTRSKGFRVNTFRSTRPVREQNPLQPQQQQYKMPVDPVTGRPLQNALPEHLLPSSPHNPFNKSSLPSQPQPLKGTTTPPLSSTTTTIKSRTPKPESRGLLLYSLRSIFRIAIVLGAAGGWAYLCFYINPKLLARIVGAILLNNDINKYLKPEHEDEYFYPIDEGDPYASGAMLYQSYQQDVVKKLFHIVNELNHFETNYEELSQRLSLHYREILKVRAYKIDDLDLWLLPLHLTKSQKRIRNQLAFDPTYPAQVDLSVIKYLRTEAMWTYWDMITTKVDKWKDNHEEFQEAMRDLIELRQDIDQLIDVLDLTTLIAYETKLFTYQYIPQTHEEMAEWEQFREIQKVEKANALQRALFPWKKGQEVPEAKSLAKTPLPLDEYETDAAKWRDDNIRHELEEDQKKRTEPYLLGPVIKWLNSFYPSRNIFNLTVKPEDRDDDYQVVLGMRQDEDSPGVLMARDDRRYNRSQKNGKLLDAAVTQLQTHADNRTAFSRLRDKQIRGQVTQNAVLFPTAQKKTKYIVEQDEPETVKKRPSLDPYLTLDELSGSKQNPYAPLAGKGFFDRSGSHADDNGREGEYSQILSVAAREKQLLELDSGPFIPPSSSHSLLNRGSSSNSSSNSSSGGANPNNNTNQQHQQSNSGPPRTSERGKYVDTYTNYGNKSLAVTFDSDLDPNELQKIDQLPSPQHARSDGIKKQQREISNREYRDRVREQMYGETHDGNSKGGNGDKWAFMNQDDSTKQYSPTSTKHRQLEERLISSTGGGFISDNEFNRLASVQQQNDRSNPYRDKQQQPQQSRQNDMPSRWG